MANKNLRVVIKIGSSSLEDENGAINYNLINQMMKIFSSLQKQKIHLVLVTSGAIAFGMNELHLSAKPKDMSLKQACAALGQAKLMEIYNEFASKYDLLLGQILLNHDDFEKRKRMLYLQNTLEAMFTNNIIPVINENDALAVEEIKVGDNDTLASLICPMINADLLILFSDIDGLYTKNPKIYNDATLIKEVANIDDSIYQIASSSTSKVGTGGMETKINAALIATSCGSDMIICNAKEMSSLEEIIKKKNRGTLFLRKDNIIPSKEHWLIFKTKEKGFLVVDEGVEEELNKETKISILPKGIVEVKGEFLKDDIIAIINKEGKLLAKGKSSLSSFEVNYIKGLPSSQIKEVIPYPIKKEAVHASNLVVIKEKIYGRIIK
ncbi:MAG: glutamate 5-kinase [Bacilli bacterium]